ncbi:NEDD4-binding protein 2 [Chamberlinius hualienensis]
MSEVGPTLSSLTADILQALAAKLSQEQNMNSSQYQQRFHSQQRRPKNAKSNKQQQQWPGQQQQWPAQQPRVGQAQQQVKQQETWAKRVNKNPKQSGTNNQHQQTLTHSFGANSQQQQSPKRQENWVKRPNNLTKQPTGNNQHQTAAKGKGGAASKLTPKEVGLLKIRNNEKLLILMRGCPGSGKTTLANEMKHNGVVLSADHFFMRNRRYEFDPAKLNEAHVFAQRNCKQEMERATSPIIIDNTNLEAWEMMPYVNMAVKHQYFILLLEPETKWKYKPAELASRNTHKVPYDKIARMLEIFDRNITAFHLLKSSKINQNMELKSPNRSQVQQQQNSPSVNKNPYLKKNRSESVQRPNFSSQHFSSITSENLTSHQATTDDGGWSSSDEEWEMFTSNTSNSITRSKSVPDMLNNFDSSMHHRSSPFVPVHSPQKESVQQSSYMKDLQDLNFSLSTSPINSISLQQAHSTTVHNTNGLLGISNPKSLASNWEIPVYPGSHLIQSFDTADDNDNSDDKSDTSSKAAEINSSESESREEDPIKTLQSFFSAVPEDSLRDIYQKCNGNLEWVVNLLLDSGYEMKVPSVDDEQHVENDGLQNEENFRHPDLIDLNTLQLSDDVNSNITIPTISVTTEDETPLAAAAFPPPPIHQEKSTVDNEFSLRLDAGFAQLLQETFGPVGYNLSSDSYSGSELEVQIPFELAALIHECWSRSLQEKFAQEDAELVQMMTDEYCARMIQEEEYANCGGRPTFSVDDFPTLGAPERNSNAEYRVKQWTNGSEDLALKIKRKQLYEQFPQIDRKAIDEILESNNASYSETLNTLKLLYEPDTLPQHVIAPEFSLDYERLLLQQLDQEERKVKIESKVEEPSFLELRDRAQDLLGVRKEYFEKAKVAFQKGLKEVASYYSQKGHEYTQAIHAANKQASEMILEITNSGRKPNTLDLHLLTTREALKALTEFLNLKQMELNAFNDGRYSLSVYVITGRGNHSTEGIGKIKSAVDSYLRTKNYSCYQVNSGCIEVNLRKAMGAIIH